MAIDGFVLTENPAILAYLGRKFMRESLFPPRGNGGCFGPMRRTEQQRHCAPLVPGAIANVPQHPVSVDGYSKTTDVHCRLDHIVITAPNLSAGVEFVRGALGVVPQIGGEHPRMGTHNCLLKLGDSVFLEVISPNPIAPKPERPRWFELDELAPNAQPKLATWVARTTDIRAALGKCTESLGHLEPMSRGELNWLITIPRDGSLPFNGIAPTLIEWNSDAHPASKLQDTGCSLLKLEAFHPETARISSLLKSISFQGDFSIFSLPDGGKPYIVVHISTPTGRRQLCTP